MYAGAASIEHNGVPGKSENMIYVADSIDGPYRRVNKLVFPEITGTPGRVPYIAKVLTAPDGTEVMLANLIPEGVVGIYDIHYLENDFIILSVR